VNNEEIQMGSRKIDWLNHGLEFAVVIIGILIAFQLQQCGERSNQRQLTKDHFEYLYTETEFNRNRLERTLTLAQVNEKKLDTLAQLIALGGDVEKINQLSLELLGITTAYFKKNAFNSLVQSGDIRYVRDFELKSSIFDIYEFYKYVDFKDQIAVRTYQDRYFGFIQENFDLITYESRPIEVYQDRQFGNAIGSYQYNVKQQIAVYRDCLGVMEEFMEEL